MLETLQYFLELGRLAASYWNRHPLDWVFVLGQMAGVARTLARETDDPVWWNTAHRLKEISMDTLTAVEAAMIGLDELLFVREPVALRVFDQLKARIRKTATYK